RSCSKLVPATFDEWKNKSFAFPMLMNPKPLSVSFLIVPSAIACASSGFLQSDACHKLFRRFHLTYFMLDEGCQLEYHSCRLFNALGPTAGTMARWRFQAWMILGHANDGLTGRAG